MIVTSAAVAAMLCACGSPETPAKKTTTHVIDELETLVQTPASGLVLAVPVPGKRCRTLLVNKDGVREIARFDHITSPCYETESFNPSFTAMVYATKDSVWTGAENTVVTGPISHTPGTVHHPAYNHRNGRVYYWLEKDGIKRLRSTKPGGTSPRTEPTNMQPGTRFRFAAGKPVRATDMWEKRVQKAAASGVSNRIVIRKSANTFQIGPAGNTTGRIYRTSGPFRDFTPKALLASGVVVGATTSHLVLGTPDEKERSIATRALSKLGVGHRGAAEADFVVNDEECALYFTTARHSEYDNFLLETSVLRVDCATGATTVIARLLGDYGATVIGYVKR